MEEEVADAEVILFCLPVNPHHEIVSRIAPHLAQGSLCLTIAKGLDESGRTAAQVYDSMLTGGRHYGVIYGPMISANADPDGMPLPMWCYPTRAGFCIFDLFLGTTLICKQAVVCTAGAGR